MGNHTDLLLEKLTEFMVANPRATINDCCRALTREGVPSSKAAERAEALARGIKELAALREQA